LTIDDAHLGDIGGLGATVKSGLERHARVRLWAKPLGPDLRPAIVGDRATTAPFEAHLNVWVPVPDEAALTISLLQERYAVAPGAPCRLQTPPATRTTIAILSVNDAPELADAVEASFAPTRGRSA
jgi:hypothetical protein